MTFQQMQYVLEVYRAGSISRAAKKLFVGQSSVSLSISSVEKELGYSVFIREKNGVIPTPRGREVIAQAARICESYRIITGPEQEGCTQIWIINGGSTYCTRNAAVRLMEENKGRSDVVFRFTDASRIPQMQQVALFEADLCLRFVFAQQMHKLEAQLQDKELRWMELGEYPVAIHLGSGHRLYNAEDVDASMLEDDWFIDTAKKSMANHPIVNAVVTVRPDRVLAVSDAVLRAQMLEQGLGYMVRPVMPHAPDQLRRIPLEKFRLKLLAIYNPARPMRPEVSRYLGLLKEELARGENDVSV